MCGIHIIHISTTKTTKPKSTRDNQAIDTNTWAGENGLWPVTPWRINICDHLSLLSWIWALLSIRLKATEPVNRCGGLTDVSIQPGSCIRRARVLPGTHESSIHGNWAIFPNRQRIRKPLGEWTVNLLGGVCPMAANQSVRQSLVWQIGDFKWKKSSK